MTELARSTRVLAVLLILIGIGVLRPSPGSAQDDPFTMDFGLYVQPRYTHDLPDEGDSEGNFAVRRLRPILTGEAYGRVSYRVMAELSGTTPRLLDSWIATGLGGGATLSAGQGKIPFGWQWLVSAARLQFVDRSIAMLRFNPDRSPGVWVGGTVGGDVLEYSAGVFNGDGPNGPNVNGDLMEVARVVWTPFGPHALVEGALDFPEGPVLALGAAVLNHSVTEEDETSDVLRFNAEASFKVQGFSATAEFFTEELEPEVGDGFTTNAWYAQAGYLLPSGYEAALRYSVVRPEAEVGLDLDETEFGFALSKYFEGHDLKLQTDFIQIDRDLDEVSHRQVRMQLQLYL